MIGFFVDTMWLWMFWTSKKSRPWYHRIMALLRPARFFKDFSLVSIGWIYALERWRWEWISKAPNFYLYFLASKSTLHGRFQEVASSPHWQPRINRFEILTCWTRSKEICVTLSKDSLFGQGSLRQHANPRGQVPPGSRDTCMMMYIYVYMFIYIYIFIYILRWQNTPPHVKSSTVKCFGWDVFAHQA